MSEQPIPETAIGAAMRIVDDDTHGPSENHAFACEVVEAAAPAIRAAERERIAAKLRERASQTDDKTLRADLHWAAWRVESEDQ